MNGAEGGLTEFLAGTIRLSAPLILAALGETVVQRSGVINIGIEGMMLAGALAGFVAAHAAASAWMGVGAAVAVGVALAALFAWFCMTLKADQIVVGTGVNIAMLGLTGVLYRAAFGIAASVTAPGLPVWSVPVLSDVPTVGQALFAQTPLVYAGGIAALGVWLLLRSPAGLSLRACGASPEAADAAGVRVDAVRWTAALFGGAMAGCAGSFLTLVQTNTFTENMTSGRGFIALAVVVFGRWNPWGVLAAGLAFGATSEAQFWFQAHGSIVHVAGKAVSLPYQALLALPYLATLIVLAMSAGRYRGPKALGQPYIRAA